MLLAELVHFKNYVVIYASFKIKIMFTAEILGRILPYKSDRGARRTF